MPKWTNGPKEYDHVRQIVMDNSFHPDATIVLKNGSKFRGFIRGGGSKNNASENINAGLGPVVTSISGYILLDQTDGPRLQIDVLDIEHVIKH